jgi:hypothetical protein
MTPRESMMIAAFGCSESGSSRILNRGVDRFKGGSAARLPFADEFRPFGTSFGPLVIVLPGSYGNVVAWIPQ